MPSGRTETQLAEDRPYMPIPRTVYVKVGTDLMAELGEWSEPVQVKVRREYDDTYELIFRRVDG